MSHLERFVGSVPPTKKSFGGTREINLCKHRFQNDNVTPTIIFGWQRMISLNVQPLPNPENRSKLEVARSTDFALMNSEESMHGGGGGFDTNFGLQRMISLNG